MAIQAPYGSWKSPISADAIVRNTVSFAQPTLVGKDIYWLEGRPQEGGRVVLVKRTPDGSTYDLTPPPFNVRTRVHEYGGGAFAVTPHPVFDDLIHFSNFSDQRLYRYTGGQPAVPVTPESGGALRYADGVVDVKRRLLYCVREDHRGIGSTVSEAVNSLAAIDIRKAAPQDEGRVIVSGNNFYSTPRLSPDGKHLCWLTWNHPNMPWDGTELWIGDLDDDGRVIRSHQVAGGEEESIFQPSWAPNGTLYYISDRTGWWNLYRHNSGREENIYPLEAEFGTPQWVFGMSTYAFESTDRIICSYLSGGVSHLVELNTRSLKVQPLDVDFTRLSSIQAADGKVVFLAGSPDRPTGIYQYDLDTRKLELIRLSRGDTEDSRYISFPDRIEFPTEGALTAFGYYYPPTNPEYEGMPGEKPPLVVMSHGGPTGGTSPTYRLDVYYLTSRGIAVLDVDYGGSSGYGRDYRRRLNGEWGVVDVDDCTNGALYLVERGLADPERLAITGGSAGGYTTLCALTFKDAFRAGASHFGIGDLETFVHDTHKFESRYLETLVGKYPEEKETYFKRSPINFTDNLSCAMILFQGLEDKIVPPSQSETMYEAVLKKGLPVAYLPFEGEQHGFRKAENIKRSLEGELYFYSKVFGFDLADPVEPVDIKNLRGD